MNEQIARHLYKKGSIIFAVASPTKTSSLINHITFLHREYIFLADVKKILKCIDIFGYD